MSVLLAHFYRADL